MAFRNGENGGIDYSTIPSEQLAEIKKLEGDTRLRAIEHALGLVPAMAEVISLQNDTEERVDNAA